MSKPTQNNSILICILSIPCIPFDKNSKILEVYSDISIQFKSTVYSYALVSYFAIHLKKIKMNLL